MKELKEMYNLMLEKLRGEHNTWVESNQKINALSDSLRKLGYKNGDTSSNPAINLLKDAFDKEVRKNGELTTEMYAHKDLIRDFELNAKRYELELKGTYEIFGY